MNHSLIAALSLSLYLMPLSATPARAAGIPVIDVTNLGQTTVNALENVAQTLGSTMAEMIRKNLNIAPTLHIRPGYRFNVMVTKDMLFDGPYHGEKNT